MKDVAAKITCPILIVDSEENREMCQMGAIFILNARILDWLDDIGIPQEYISGSFGILSLSGQLGKIDTETQVKVFSILAELFSE